MVSIAIDADSADPSSDTATFDITSKEFSRGTETVQRLMAQLEIERRAAAMREANLNDEIEIAESRLKDMTLELQECRNRLEVYEFQAGSLDDEPIGGGLGFGRRSAIRSGMVEEGRAALEHDLRRLRQECEQELKQLASPAPAGANTVREVEAPSAPGAKDTSPATPLRPPPPATPTPVPRLLGSELNFIDRIAGSPMPV